MSNQLESLSNELLLDIFEYLDAYKLCKAFYGLNHRFNDLLRLARLHISFNSTNKDKTIWNALASFARPSQIRTLSSYDDIAIDERFLPSAEQNLRLLCLQSMSQSSVNEIIQRIPTDNQMKSLYISEKWDWPRQGDASLLDFLLVDHGHRFVSVANLSLSSVTNIFPVVSTIFSQLRRLSIAVKWDNNFFQFIQDKTPNLRSLKLQESRLLLDESSKFALQHIHELHINYSGALANLQSLLCMFPCLRRLHIDWGNTRRSPVLNGTQWQQLIEKYLPSLKQLTINLDEGIDEQILKTFYTGEFWSTKKVKAKMAINKRESRYRLVKTIYFGRQWQFNYFHEAYGFK